MLPVEGGFYLVIGAKQGDSGGLEKDGREEGNEVGDLGSGVVDVLELRDARGGGARGLSMLE